MERFLLDTNIVSYILKGRSPAARAQLASLRTDQIACISTITEGEIRYGLAKFPGVPEHTRVINAFLAKIKILAWDRDAARAYGTLRAHQESIGRKLGNLDLLIAAHCIAAEATLVTNDKTFVYANGLAGNVNWATDL